MTKIDPKEASRLTGSALNLVVQVHQPSIWPTGSLQKSRSRYLENTVADRISRFNNIRQNRLAAESTENQFSLGSISGGPTCYQTVCTAPQVLYAWRLEPNAEAVDTLILAGLENDQRPHGV